MTLPRWLAELNKRFINPRAARSGDWPVLVHVGRSSGAVYRTPIGAMAVDGGYLIFVNYGRRTDWLKNVLSAGAASLEVDGQTVEVGNPRLVSMDAGRRMLGDSVKVPPGWVGVNECLLLEQT